MAKLPIPAAHELRQHYHYKPETGAIIRISDGREASCCPTPFGHLQLVHKRRPLLAHRVAWALHHGEWPQHQIDHIDRNPANNVLANLRDVTQSLNQHNTGKRKDNTTGYPGVRAKNGRFQVTIKLHGKEHFLGTFDTAEEAFAARHAFKQARGLLPPSDAN